MEGTNYFKGTPTRPRTLRKIKTLYIITPSFILEGLLIFCSAKRRVVFFNLFKNLHIVLGNQPRGACNLAQEPAWELSRVDPEIFAFAETELRVRLGIKVVQPEGLPIGAI